MSHQERINDSLKRAVDIMRAAVEDAARTVDLGQNPSQTIRQVMHCFAWGNANASAQIEGAMAARGEFHEVEAVRRGES